MPNADLKNFAFGDATGFRVALVGKIPIRSLAVAVVNHNGE
jgi:hypothetical protein